ncbi:PfkB family carbohydrate kinase [Halocola ammonii]
MELLERIQSLSSELKVLVVGETIIDEFVNVSYEGQSMKSMCPVFRLEGEKTEQEGGAGAIANHLRPFVKDLKLVTNENREIVKTRYVDVGDEKKHVEVNKFDTSSFGPFSVDVTAYDVVIVADFGHGFCNEIDINEGFHLMCQTNSNNFGFNRLSKWKDYRKKSVCLDLREASLQMNKRIKKMDRQSALDLYGYEMNTEDLFATIGKDGAVYTNGSDVIFHPSFKSEIVDTIGAGDTFFAFACLMSHLDLDPKEILTLPSLAASLSTTWLCNEKSVTPQLLQDYAKGKDTVVPKSL